MSIEPTEIQCANPECRIFETGKCVEGLTLDKCPHVDKTGISEQVLATENPILSESIPDIGLAKSERLSVQDASSVMRAVQTRVIGIIGPTSSGKTSLIASLCDLFQRGRVGGFQFAKSRTLFAFEQACHHARAASRRNSPQTEHTSLATGLGFYQLAIQSLRRPKILHLLLADRSGEDYRAVTDDPSAAAEFVEVRRADILTVLVNGELLLGLSSRHNVRNEIVMILEGLLNGDVLYHGQRLAMVLTKLDMIHEAAAEARERTERDFEALVMKIRSIFSTTFREIRSFKIAASPTTKILEHGFGVTELLQFWAEPVVLSSSPKFMLPESARAMGRFGLFDSETQA